MFKRINCKEKHKKWEKNGKKNNVSLNINGV